jgi:DNA-binding response OmpR family regulator
MSRVLLIEDNDDDRQLFTRLTTRAGWSADSAPDLSTGLARVSAQLPDAVLLDLHLPDGSGIDVLRTLVHRHPEVPIVVLTGVENEDLGLRAVREGAQDYLVKGQVDGKLLDRSLRYAIERKRAERALARLAAITSGLCDECGRKLAAPGDAGLVPPSSLKN